MVGDVMKEELIFNRGFLTFWKCSKCNGWHEGTGRCPINEEKQKLISWIDNIFFDYFAIGKREFEKHNDLMMKRYNEFRENIQDKKAMFIIPNTIDTKDGDFKSISKGLK